MSNPSGADNRCRAAQAHRESRSARSFMSITAMRCGHVDRVVARDGVVDGHERPRAARHHGEPGRPGNGYPRQDGFDIVVASEVMAIFCLSNSLEDLKERLGKIVVGYTRDQKPVLARDLQTTAR